MDQDQTATADHYFLVSDFFPDLNSTYLFQLKCLVHICMRHVHHRRSETFVRWIRSDVLRVRRRTKIAARGPFLRYTDRHHDCVQSLPLPLR
jgi:hypothetical protein